jgi:hypothetical protein
LGIRNGSGGAFYRATWATLTCTVCEACDLHCLEGDTVRCALLVLEATSYLRDERSLCAVRQLAWVLQVKKGMTAAAAAAAAHKLVYD